MSDLRLDLELCAERAAESCLIGAVDLLPLELFVVEIGKAGHEDLERALFDGIERAKAMRPFSQEGR